MFFFLSDSLSNAQTVAVKNNFQLINKSTGKTVAFSFKKKILFQIKEDSLATFNSLTSGCINTARGIYEFKLLDFTNKELVFENNIKIPINQIKWVHFRYKTSPLIGFGVILFGTALLMDTFTNHNNWYANLILMPFSMGWIIYSMPQYYSLNDWQFQK